MKSAELQNLFYLKLLAPIFDSKNTKTADMPSNKKKLLAPSPNFSPLKKQKRKFGNYVDMIETNTPHFVLAVFTRADKNESPYMKPIIDAFEEDNTGELAEQWQVIKIVQMKGEKNEDGTYQTKTVAPDSRFFWYGFVAYMSDEHASPDSLGLHLAKQFNKFVEECDIVSIETCVMQLIRISECNVLTQLCFCLV